MKFIPVTAKTQTLWLTSGAIIGAIALWSASMATEVTVGRSGYAADGSPIVTQVNRQTKNKGLFLAISAGLLGAAAFAFVAKDKDGDRLIDPKTLGTDMGEASKVLGNNLACAMSFVSVAGFKWAFGKQSVVRSITLSVMPVPMKDFLKDSISKKGWFKDFLAVRRHYILCGSTGDGKSMLTIAILMTYLANAQASVGASGLIKDQLAICDINYGKCDDKGNQNTWLDLPRSYISVSVEEIMTRLRSIRVELQRRRSEDAEHAPLKASDPVKYKKLRDAVTATRGNILIVVEEFMNTRDQIKTVDPELLKEFDGIIAEILRDGRGYLIKLMLILQYLNASKGGDGNGFNLGLRRQCAIILLKTIALQVEQVKGISNDAEALVAKFLEALKKSKYLAMVQIEGGDPNIFEIEDLSWTKDASIRSPVDPIEKWWQQIWTESNQQWIIERLEHGPSPTSSAVRPEFKKRFGIEPSSKDPKYAKLKAVIEQIKVKTNV